MRPYFRNLGMASTVGFLAMAILSTTAAYSNVDGSFRDPKRAALFFALFWSGWCLLGIWLILAYYRYRLIADANEIRQIGFIRQQHAPLSQVRELKWRRLPAHGSVKLSGLFGVLKIDFGTFAPPDRKDLISFLRTTIESSRQIGWAEFDEHFHHRPTSPKTASRRARIWWAVFFIPIGIAFFGAWFVGLGDIYLLASAVNIVYGTYLLIKSIRHNESQGPNTDAHGGETERLHAR